MSHLGDVLGGSAEQNNSAITSAIPWLLSGLLNSGSSNKSGDNDMLSVINAQDEGILDTLGDLVGGRQQSSIMESGTNILSSLLGDNLGKLISKINHGLTCSHHFSVYKRKLLSGGGLNVGGLMDMLNGQKENISAAMPASFEQQLNASGFLNNIGSNVANVADCVTSAAGDTALFLEMPHLKVILCLAV